MGDVCIIEKILVEFMKNRRLGSLVDEMGTNAIKTTVGLSFSVL
jgi:hypothetical protein